MQFPSCLSCAIINFLLVFLTRFAGYAAETQSDPQQAESGGDPSRELSHWVMHYYQKPQPEEFETRVRQMAKCNMLRTQEPIFFSRVMAQNPSRIAAWLDRLKDLPEADRAVLQKAAWLSDTKEAEQWLAKMGINQYAGKHPPDFFKGPQIITPTTVDDYWAWFFATGEVAPVKAVVACFYAGAIQFPDVGAGPEGRPLPPKPDPDDKVPFGVRMANYRVFEAAVWSSTSLAREHPLLLQHLKTIESQSPDMNPKQKAWLQHVIRLVEKEPLRKAPK
jgi:hypothetical protein